MLYEPDQTIDFIHLAQAHSDNPMQQEVEESKAVSWFVRLREQTLGVLRSAQLNLAALDLDLQLST